VTRSFMEARFGYDFGGVRVHPDAKAAESAQAVNALAYTVGPHTVFAPGRYQPTSFSGRKLLAHELTHVVQQGDERTPAQIVRQRPLDVAGGCSRSEAPAIVQAALDSPGDALDRRTRTFFGDRFGRDPGDVRLHTDARAVRSAAGVGALAPVVGPDVVSGAGQFAPETPGGLRALAHEPAHVAQHDRSGGTEHPVLHRTSHGPGTPTNCHNWTIPLPPWIAGSIAHGQISATLGILPHVIPRATKLFMGIPNPPGITPSGFADLWTVFGPAVNMAEIKSTARGSGVAASEARHYVLRHDEWLARVLSGLGDARDATYLASAGGPLPGGLLDLSAVTGTDLVLGPFTGDPAKLLHIEADSSGAMVYWCTGTGMVGSPLWIPLLKKALDELKKQLQDALRVVQDLAEAAAEAAARFGRALPALLRVLFIVLLLLTIIACLIVAVVCALGIPVTLGGSSICSGAAVGGAVLAAVAILLIVGISAPGLPDASANLARALNPASAQGEAENAADYERDSDTPSTLTTPAAAATAVAAYNPMNEFLDAFAPIAGLINNPAAAMRTIANSLGSLPADAVARLNDAATALSDAGDTATSSFIRNTIRNSALDKPGALAAFETSEIDRALAQLEQRSGDGHATPFAGEGLNPEEATA
jgi:hypothetical protein